MLFLFQSIIWLSIEFLGYTALSCNNISSRADKISQWGKWDLIFVKLVWEISIWLQEGSNSFWVWYIIYQETLLMGHVCGPITYVYNTIHPRFTIMYINPWNFMFQTLYPYNDYVWYICPFEPPLLFSNVFLVLTKVDEVHSHICLTHPRYFSHACESWIRTRIQFILFKAITNNSQ